MKYYIVCYAHKTGLGEFGKACEIIPTRKDIKEHADEYSLSNAVLTNLIRVSEDEYAEYFGLKG